MPYSGRALAADGASADIKSRRPAEAVFTVVVVLHAFAAWFYRLLVSDIGATDGIEVGYVGAVLSVDGQLDACPPPPK